MARTIDGKRYLNDKELTKINDNDFKCEFGETKVGLEKSKLNELLLKNQLLAHKIEAQKGKIIEMQRQLSELDDARRTFLQLVAKKNKLKPGWGFKPESGEIVTED